MALPPSASTTVIRGRFQNTDGDPLAVTVTFVPEPKRIVCRTDRVILYNATVTAQSDPATGEFSVEVLSSDDPDLDPYDWTYTVRITGAVTDTLTGVPAPKDAPVDPDTGKATIDLTDLVTGSASQGLGRVYVLAALTDVDLSTPPLDGQQLVYNAATGKWTGGGVAATPTWDSLEGKPSTFPPSPHTHPTSEVDGLDAALASKADVASLAPVATSGAYTDLTGLPSIPSSPEDIGAAPAVHSHSTAEVAGLDAALAGKADTSSLAPVATSGAYADLTGLPAIPSAPEDIGAAPAAHTHSTSEVSGLDAALDAALDGKVDKGALVVDVHDYGAVGDGAADDTPALTAALAAAANGGVVKLRQGRLYRVDSTWTINKPCTVDGAGASIIATVPGLTMIDVTASDVILTGFRVNGPGGSYVDGAHGIRIQGAAAAAPIRRVSIRNVEVGNVPFRGIFAQYAEDVNVEGCYVHDVVYAGIGFWSVIRGSIVRCRISNITNSGYVNGNAYGIELSRAETDNLATDPRTSDILVQGNHVSDVPTWEGIDTHGGQRIQIVDNTVLRCSRGIVVTSGDAAGQVPTFAPLACLVRGNLVESGVSDGSRSYGIHFNGVLNGSTPGERATGIIADNMIVQHGIQTSASDSGAGAIRVYVTDGIVIRGNVIVEPGNIGINLVTHNRAYAVIGNVVMEPWSNTSGALPAAIRQYNGNSNGLVIGNQLIATGTKAGAVVRNQHGFRHNATNSTVQVAANDFSAAAVPQFPTTLAGWVDGLWGTRATRYTATGSETAATIVAQLQSEGVFG